MLHTITKRLETCIDIIVNLDKPIIIREYFLLESLDFFAVFFLASGLRVTLTN